MVETVSRGSVRTIGVRRAAFATAILAAAFGCGSHVGTSNDAADTPLSTTEALNTSPVLNNFVVYAQRSVKLGSGDIITGGDVGVATAAVAAFGTQLTVGDFAVVQPTHNILAPSVSLGFHSRVGDVQTPSLQNSGGALDTLGTFPASIMPPVPLALPSTTTGADVTVHDFEARTLTPGNYGALKVDGVALLEVGSFSFTSVQIGAGARLLAEHGGVIVQVAGTLNAGRFSEIAPIEVFDFFDWGHHQGTSAAGLSIAVAGADGSSGAPPAVDVEEYSSVTALITAPHGTVSIGNGTAATGAFAGSDVSIGSNAVVRFQSLFTKNLAVETRFWQRIAHDAQSV